MEKDEGAGREDPVFKDPARDHVADIAMAGLIPAGAAYMAVPAFKVQSGLEKSNWTLGVLSPD